MQQSKNVLLISMPFAILSIPSIQLQILENYLSERNIDVKSRHLYLKSADFYGLIDYNFLTYPPNDSYNAQIFFTKYVFPEHFQEHQEEIKKFVHDKIIHDTDNEYGITFEKYEENTDRFFNWSLENVEWKNYDIIGFTLNYGQLLSSLAFAKKIKEQGPNKTIVFGGSRVVDELGMKILETFDYIDFIVSGEGEEALELLATDFENYEKIPNLIYRKGRGIKFNKSEKIIDLNLLPLPNFDSFYHELENCSDVLQQNFHLNGRLAIEISRGCWWNKCKFCNLNIQHKIYREKNVDKIIDEIKYLTDKYNILSYQIISNTILKNDHKEFLEKIIGLNKDYTFFVEARAGQLKSDDYKLLRKAGFITIQTGIETFSKNYIKKMNKGARVIDNIASLIYCKENSISNSYNLIINFPNEEHIDFEETEKTVEIIKNYIDPPTKSPLIVGYGSPIYNDPDAWNIKSLDYIDSDKVMFPDGILQKNICFFYKFKTKKDLQKNEWSELIDQWKKDHQEAQIEAVKKKTDLDRLIFFYQDGGDFIKIYDKRDINNFNIFILDELERKIFLSCKDVKSYEKIQEEFPELEDFKLAAIMHSFEDNGIVFCEDDCYLSLPLCYSQAVNQLPRREMEQEALYASGINRNL